MAANAVAAYRWEDPGGSFAVHVSLDVVDRLSAAMQEGLERGLRRMEVGGLLLGSTAAGGRTILIEDFSLVPSEHLRGPSYTLSPKERRSLGGRLAHHKAGEVVGFFRSHSRQGLYLDQDDLATFSSYFAEPSQVFLVVRPAADGPAMGGFFFWEAGDMDRRSPHRQFPFDRQRLLSGDFPITYAPAARPVAPQVGRRVPQVHWVTVPAIAGLFVIAGLFESAQHTPQTAAVPEKARAADVASLPPAGISPKAAAAQSTEQTKEFAQEGAPTLERINETAPPEPASQAPRPAPVRAARVSPREVAPPPTLAVPIRKQAELAMALPARTPYLPPPPEAEVSYTPAQPSVFRRVLHRVSPFPEADVNAFVPPKPIRKVTPAVPPDATAPAPEVDVKIFIDEAGNVSRAQLLTKRTGLADPSLIAARQWQFAPARKRDKPVSSEMVLHFRFGALAVD